MPKILIVDDDPLTLHNLSRWLTASGYDVHTATNGVSAMDIARREALDVVITDLRMPGLDGHGVLALIKELEPRIEVIIISGFGTMEDAIAALSESRAFQFLQKPIKDLQLLNLTIEKALLKRQRNIAPSSASPIATSMCRKGPLSERERQMMALVASGQDNDTIAQKLCLSPKTVRNTLSRIYDKLGVSNRMQAVITWQQCGCS